MFTFGIFVALNSSLQIEFLGGNPQKLVASLYETFEVPVFVSSSKPVFSSISSKAKTSLELIGKLEAATDLASSSVISKEQEDMITDVIFTNSVIASRVVRRDGRPSDLQQGLSYGDRLSMLKISEGKVSIFDHAPLNLGNWLIVQQEWSKPIEMHWYVKILTCAFNFDQLSEKQFLTNLSKACIGKFTESDKNYKVDLDVSRFKKMWVDKHKVRRKAESENPVRVAFHDTCIAALERTSLAEITKMMNKPGQFHSFNISPTSTLDRKLREYLQLHISGADISSKSESYRALELESRRRSFSQADWSKPLRITLYNGGRVDLLIPTGKEKTYIAHSG